MAARRQGIMDKFHAPALARPGRTRGRPTMQGDVFPAYSSLRADPLGAKALYQALELLPGVSAQRHYRDVSKLADEPE